jgi:sugar fermentation stimulation protein A
MFDKKLESQYFSIHGNHLRTIHQMKYTKVRQAKFIERPNRFIARVEMDGRLETVHVRNTGRCREILIPGTTVYLEEVDKPERKTRYSLTSAYKGQCLINIDSQIPNAVAGESIRNGLFERFQPLIALKPEAVFGSSRFDFYYETPVTKGFIEVKGVTLERDGLALFPDAPTERGTKHLHELITTLANGYQSYLLFLIQMKGVSRFSPNTAMDPDFSQALKKAVSRGVEILAYDSIITPDSMELGDPVPVDLL